MSWNPDLYLNFADHRLRPALDLLARVPLDAPRRIVDLGCGPGNVTQLLATRWPGARLTGIDNASSMIERARRDYPSLAWQLADIATWQAEAPVDLVFTNAALQWLDGHAALFPRLFSQLAPAGVLAVQMPRNFAAPTHTAIRETVEAGPWRARLQPLLRPEPIMSPAAYYRLLTPQAKRLDIWESEYVHVLNGASPVLEWVRATALRPFLAALDERGRGAFEDAYRARVDAAYPPEAGGETLLSFRRLFIVACA